MKTDSISLRFEKILERALARGQTALEVFGCDSTLALALFLSQNSAPDLWQQPQLIVVPTAKEATELEAHLRFFDGDAKVSILPAFDVSPYSGLYPNARVMSARVRWIHEAHQPSNRQFFIATVEGLAQRTMPRSVLSTSTQTYRINDELPSKLAQTLDRVGYQSVPVVEDEGTYAIRGGIVDIYSPAHRWPVRIELFGDTIDSMRFFNPETQRSEATANEFTLLPPREILFSDEVRIRVSSRYRRNVEGRDVDATDRDGVLQSLVQGQVFPGIDFLIGDFYEEFTLPLDHFKTPTTLWYLNPIELAREGDRLMEGLKHEYAESQSHAILPALSDLYVPFEELPKENIARTISLSKVEIHDSPFDVQTDSDRRITITSMDLKFPPPASGSPMDALTEALGRVHSWRSQGFSVFVSAATQAQSQRLLAFFEKSEFSAQLVKEGEYHWNTWVEEQKADSKRIHVIPRTIAESLRLTDEELIFLRDEDFFGKKQRKREYKSSGTLTERAHALSFGDLKPGDHVVHTVHGIGVYEGLKVMPIGGIPAEYIQIAYKDGDKLYLPIYRVGQIQKFSGPTGERLIDKLGGTQWQKTKIRVRSHLRELASELLQLYAKRSQAHRPSFPENDDDFSKFEAAFPYDETDDQLKAVNDIVGDMTSDRPMDRLVCGDVGFGKTEVAMRAAFKAIEGRKQVAVLAPTTVLSFQHWETFSKRFKSWPVTIKALNRFVPNSEVRQTIEELREGKVDIVIGTHRLLSKDIAFKDLGLMIIDEEQRFGVTHKEKIKRMKTSVDTLTLSATPIPRTLNMSLVGMRDLSIINTPPVDRLPTRTFVTKYDKETIRKAITSEIQRGGQVFFLHNRVQTIYQTADEIREIVPEARIRVGHGQMDEDELEKTMIAFFHHQVDVLVCTTIIESGIDNPRANTMFIDNAHQFGLSQLYQLRGRVGRSKERAYCYLLIPANKRIETDAQERLKIIQENTALGSGIKIAHHDLELRGAGNILGEDQSGQIDAVGYEMYLELLEEAIRTVKGEEVHEQIEPEINVRIPALIPDAYIGDIRIRLSYYKAMSEISAPEDMDRIEEELSDQFGKLPEQVINLMGLMLIRHHCRELGIRDLSSGPKTISLAFTERTPLPPQTAVALAQTQRQKYSITPDMRLIIRLETISWPNIYDELQHLKGLCSAPPPNFEQLNKMNSSPSKSPHGARKEAQAAPIKPSPGRGRPGR
jgi:transcription-repair coupling factor (superfamily II helicase)